MNEWEKGFNIVNQYLHESGILKDCKQIIYSINGDYSEFIKKYNENNLMLSSENVDKYEFPTINILYNESLLKNQKVLYIHTKGASSGINKPIEDWIHVMSYFNITEYKKCLELLDEYDAVGVDYHVNPFKHFSGNFWWSKSSHIRGLRELSVPGDERHAAERWICSIDGKYKSLHDTNIDVYQRHLHEYPSQKYR